MLKKLTTIFTDIGGVLLTNGWDHTARQNAVEHFSLNGDEVAERHHLVYDVYECGKMTLDDYLDYIVFYEQRTFTKEAFKTFMYSCSQSFEDVITLMKNLKQQYGLKIIAVSNEGREINQHRIEAFKLNSFIDVFLSSCYLHLRKPDAEIFQLAIDVAQTPLENCVYIDDRPIHVEAAKKQGLTGIVHKNYSNTKLAIERLLVE